MSLANPNNRSKSLASGASDAEVDPKVILGFVLAVLVVVIVAVVVGITTDQLTSITAATVAIVGCAVAAFRIRR